MKDMNNKLLILFGKAGTGKNYVAIIIENTPKLSNNPFMIYEGEEL